MASGFASLRRTSGGAKALVKRLPMVKRLRRSQAPVGPTKLNIGAGKWTRPGWTTVDFYEGADVNVDLRECPRLPFADGSCSRVFSSHVLEHLDDRAVMHLLREIARVLAPGGVVRLSVPDGAAAMLAYEYASVTFFDHGGVLCVGPDIEHKLVNFFASYRLAGYSGGPVVDPDEVAKRLRDEPSVGEFAAWCRSLIPTDAEYVAHVNGYDADRLLGMMREAGLHAATRSVYRGSQVAELRRPDFDNRPFVSLFVEAVKQ